MPAQPAKPFNYYRWIDTNGVVNYTQLPPPEGIKETPKPPEASVEPARAPDEPAKKEPAKKEPAKKRSPSPTGAQPPGASPKEPKQRSEAPATDPAWKRALDTGIRAEQEKRFADAEERPRPARR